MKYFKYLFLFLLMGCSTSRVITDYNAEINFSNFKTYAFYEDVGVGLNELDVKRVTNIVNFKLEQLGFLQSDNPDFFINIKSKMSEAQNNNTIGIGLGTGGINGGFGVSGGIPIGGKKLNEAFTIEFVNAENNILFWQAILNSTIKEKRKPEQKELHFQEIIAKILEKYPPK
ncbi:MULTISPECIES: DUF4136 domain-containing protein [unclassified Polaribacter]|uniref:DUF4136 domain-containing protein n=1 Tax=unclassified Polaribacter TaxID=196858 RepID=UPI0011BEC8D1|nr:MULTISPECIES: DUF4136 domain-containing protein [unclassified Polaribacter]TXD54274.1 DUF4136 domain-containing protein [Polaribacter sp. IC063]TXD62895.1 DUF4136 domain-containing protein [Polaribacter sp. IC066]